MKLKKLLFGLLTCLLFGSCSEDDKIPADADENFITSVSLSVNNETYDAVIADNTITITVPYTISLKGATATFVYTPSAKIIPDPATITDWDVERTFRVTSFNGETNDYTYVVIKDEIRHEGDVELKTPSDVAAFVASGVTIIKGNLIIGSDAENAEEIKDISALEILKEVEGDIIIRQSYTGGTLTGLDNITSIGGLYIGTSNDLSNAERLEVISMRNLTSVKGSVNIFNNTVTQITFNSLTTTENDLVVYSKKLNTILCPELENINGSLKIDGGGQSNLEIIEFPKLKVVGDSLRINNIKGLNKISCPILQEAGSIDFSSLPIHFEKLSLPNLITVNGDFNIISNYNSGDLFTSTGNNVLTSFDEMTKIVTVKGKLSICNFEEISSLPILKNITELGSLALHKLTNCSGAIDIRNATFLSNSQNESIIDILECKKIEKLITKNDLSNVSVSINAWAGMNIDFNFTKVKNLSYVTPDSNKDFILPLEEVHGNLYFSTGMRSGIIANNLKFIDGYMHIKISMFASKLEFPLLEKIGGQLFIEGTLNNSSMTYDFNHLKSICCNPNPSYSKKGLWNTNSLPYGGLDIRSTTTYDLFPTLEKVGGTGITIHGFTAFSCPNLITIEGKLSADAASRLNSFDLPKLQKLSGVNFVRLTSFSDFSMFGTFINNSQISEENWTVSECAYNPTYQDMKEGRYKPAE